MPYCSYKIVDKITYSKKKTKKLMKKLKYGKRKMNKYTNHTHTTGAQAPVYVNVLCVLARKRVCGGYSVNS